MPDTALIFGAGKTGRGFAAHLAFLGGYEIVLIDSNRQLVDDLKNTHQYDIQVLDNQAMSCTIPLSGVFHIEDESWFGGFVKAGIVFTAVFGNNLEPLASFLARALQKRFAQNIGQMLTIITCENATGAAGFLKEMVLKSLDVQETDWVAENIGFSESIIFKTCLSAAESQSPLTIRAQNYFELPCDAEAIKGAVHVYGLKPLHDFGNQLRRKIFTYNCINAVITYLGAQKGYSQLYEAGNDPEILEQARKAANETSLAQVAEFHFDEEEQTEWVKAAFIKFADKNMPDPIERNAADPIRKLSRNDRLIGPALLALKYGIYPEGLLAGILACFDYPDSATNKSVADLIKDKGPEFVLTQICGLSCEEELFTLISKHISNNNEW